MKLKTFLKESYRLIQVKGVKKYALRFFFSKVRLQDSFWNQFKTLPLKEPLARSFNKEEKGRKKCIWIHAASVGELESLWPLAIGLARSGNDFVLTILSESAKGSLEKLRVALLEMGAHLFYCGYSPWEGEWSFALKRFQPQLFVTAKYEAWPDLWISLKEQGIPLAIVSVHARKSLRIAKWFSHFLAGGVPDLVLFPCEAAEVPALRLLFPNAKIGVAGEPRWDRVQMRAQLGSPRAQHLIQTFRNCRRPWGVLGSVWMEDLKFLGPCLKEFPGTLWIVPHRIDENNLKEIEAFLVSMNLSPVRSSKDWDSQAQDLDSQPQKTFLQGSLCILVDEMGFLSELYSVADWAFVGGGFGVGVHSTIEPALYGIPIATGPSGVEKFYEIQELSRTGQLKVLRTKEDLLKGCQFLTKVSPQQRSEWSREAKGRLGATQKILSGFEEILKD